MSEAENRRNRLAAERETRGKKTVVSSMPNCDLCQLKNVERLAKYDCRVPSFGSWGNVCQQHYDTEGCSLGVGHGQELVLGK